jgi:hypothetical protein
LGTDDKNCDYYIGEPLKYEKAPDEDYPWGYRDGAKPLMTVAKESNRVSFGPRLNFSDFAAAAAKSEEGSVWRKECAVKFKTVPEHNLTFEVTPQRWAPPLHQSLYNSTNYSQWLSGLPFMREMAINHVELAEDTNLNDAFKTWTTGLEDPQATQSEQASPSETVLSACGLNHYVDENRLQGTLLSNFCYVASGNAETMQNPDTFGVMHASFSNCRLSLCSRHYRNASVVAEGRIQATEITDSLFVAIHADPLKREALQAYDGAGNKFSFNQFHLESLAMVMEDLQNSPGIKQLLARNNRDSTADWIALAEQIADIYTRVIQGSFNPDSERMTAEVYGSVIFVRVRWAWFIMPLSLVIASNVLLYLTMWRSRKQSYLYKNSILATLFHGLDGWETQELVAQRTGRSRRETHEDMTRTSRGMVAVLKEDGDGYLKLKRE